MTDTTDAAVDTAAVTKRSAARPTPHHPPRLRRLTSTSNSIGPDFAKIALSLRVGPLRNTVGDSYTRDAGRPHRLGQPTQVPALLVLRPPDQRAHPTHRVSAPGCRARRSMIVDHALSLLGMRGVEFDQRQERTVSVVVSGPHARRKADLVGQLPVSTERSIAWGPSPLPGSRRGSVEVLSALLPLEEVEVKPQDYSARTGYRRPAGWYRR